MAPPPGVAVYKRLLWHSGGGCGGDRDPWPTPGSARSELNGLVLNKEHIGATYRDNYGILWDTHIGNAYPSAIPLCIC